MRYNTTESMLEEGILYNVEYDCNPYRALTADISPTEFEKFCTETLKAYAEQEGLKNFSIQHDRIINAHDGNYQIDAFGEFTALGTTIRIVIECKKHSRPIEREMICVLHNKQLSIGANKSIFMSTSGYQTGAVRYAEAHGIALLQIVDRCVKRIQASAGAPNMSFELLRMMVERQQLPKYYALLWNLSADFPETQVYPTEAMENAARRTLMESYGAQLNTSE